MLADEGQSGEADDSFLAAIDLSPDDPYLRVDYSKFLLRQRRPRQAAAEVSTARELSPDNPDILRAYAETQMKLINQDQDAIDKTREALEALRILDPDDIESMVTLGQIYLSESETEKAIEVFQEVLSKHSGNRMVYRLLVDALMRSGRIDEAENVLLEALEVDPYFTSARIGVAEMLGQQGRHREAVELIDRAPTDALPDLELRKRLAIELHRSGSYDRALDVLESVLEDEKDYFAGLYLRVVVLSSLGDLETAIREAQSLSDRYPESLEVVTLLAGLHERQGHVSEAIRELTQLEERLRLEEQPGNADRARLQRLAVLARAERWEEIAIALEPMEADLSRGEPSDLSLLYAEALAYSGRQEQSIQFLSSFTGSSPSRQIALAKQAEILLTLGDEEAARQRIDVLLSSGEFDDKVRAASIYQSLEHYDAAIPILEMALSEQPKSTQVMFWLGAAYERSARHEAAEEMLEAVLELEPDFAPALNYLGYMWAEKGEKLGRALDLVQQAVKLEPNNGAYIDSLGWTHYQLGNYDKAQNLLERAATLVGDDAIVFEHLGDLYVAQGDFEAARDVYQRALDLEAENASQVRQKLADILDDF
jgi:tetratricopeptide (TPR) repeat protein